MASRIEILLWRLRRDETGTENIAAGTALQKVHLLWCSSRRRVMPPPPNHRTIKVRKIPGLSRQELGRPEPVGLRIRNNS
jgi:hypothetical protein